MAHEQTAKVVLAELLKAAMASTTDATKPGVQREAESMAAAQRTAIENAFAPLKVSSPPLGITTPMDLCLAIQAARVEIKALSEECKQLVAKNMELVQLAQSLARENALLMDRVEQMQRTLDTSLIRAFDAME